MAEHRGSRAGIDRLPFEIDAGIAHPARIHNYLAGGDDNFAADRDAVEYLSAVLPGGLDGARASVRSLRGFMERTLRYLVNEAAVRQFIKIGTTIPTTKDVHEIVQESAPASRVVYVGSDPVVLAHAHALRRSRPEGVATYIHGTLGDPQDILQQAAATLDFSHPVAVIALSTLNFVPDDDDPDGIMAQLLYGLAPGSYLAMAHATHDLHQNAGEALRRFREVLRGPFVVRSHAEIVGFFDGLKMVEPGLVQIDQWPEKRRIVAGQQMVPIYGAVGLKPLPAATAEPMEHAVDSADSGGRRLAEALRVRPSPSVPAAQVGRALTSADARVTPSAARKGQEGQEGRVAGPYRKDVSVGTKVDLADHLAIVWFILGKLGFHMESAEIRTDDRTIDEPSLSGALAAVRATESIGTVHVDLRAREPDELTATLTWCRDVRPFTEIRVRGADPAQVVEFASAVLRFVERNVPDSSASIFETGTMLIQPGADGSRNETAHEGYLPPVDGAYPCTCSWWRGASTWLGAKRDDLLVQVIGGLVAGLLVATVSALCLTFIR